MKKSGLSEPSAARDRLWGKQGCDRGMTSPTIISFKSNDGLETIFAFGLVYECQEFWRPYFQKVTQNSWIKIWPAEEEIWRRNILSKINVTYLFSNKQIETNIQFGKLYPKIKLH